MQVCYKAVLLTSHMMICRALLASPLLFCIYIMQFFSFLFFFHTGYEKVWWTEQDQTEVSIEAVQGASKFMVVCSFEAVQGAIKFMGVCSFDLCKELISL